MAEVRRVEATDFTPAEWTALFPAPSAPVDTFGGEDGAEDPAAAGRAADPFTKEAQAKEFDSQPLKGLAWLGEHLAASASGWSRWSAFICWASLFAPSTVLLAVAASWNNGQYSTGSVAVGFAGICANYVTTLSIMVLVAKMLPNGVPPDFWTTAGLFRWLRLVRAPGADSGKGETPARLVEHVAGDPVCTCATCGRHAQTAAGWLALIDMLTNYFLALAIFFFAVYTPVVTHGPRLGSTSWGITLLTLYAIALFANILAWTDRYKLTSNIAYSGLERRLQTRAVALSMRDLLLPFRDSLANGALPPRLEGGEWLYVRLHYRFVSLCRSRDRQDQSLLSRLYALIQVPLLVLCALLMAAVGRCLNVWIIVYFAHVVAWFTTNAVNLAARNSLLDAVDGLYRDAQRELRTLMLRARPGPLADEVALHVSALEGFVAATAGRARLFGFVVSYGTVRTMLVTIVTVAVALWSVLRGLGVTLTPESFCPA
ncbi:hypothetical protein DFJ74DRAFT_703274 [Hyaloraphidium curvatum]|nr:hypothetical protein DFJ74DRAFT_703274 [Hyaloraphidium curvatum]